MHISGTGNERNGEKNLVDETAPAVDDAGQPPEFRTLPRKIIILTMASVLLGIFLSALDSTVVATAMPRVISDLGGFSHYTWVSTGYLVTYTAVVPIAGKLSDVHGRKWIFVIGIGVFLAGSVLSGLSQSMTQLILFRALQGIGGGMMMTSCLSDAADLFPPIERGKWTGLTVATFGLAAIVGPALGGFITDNVSWRWVFYINIPFGLLSIAFLMLFFPNVRPAAKGQRLDVPGVITLLLAILPLLMALSWGGAEYPWTSVRVVGLLILAAVMGVAFILIELRAPHPFIPPGLFKNRIFTVCSIVMFFLGFSMFAGITFIPLYFQGVIGASATSSGSFLIPMTLGNMAGSILSGQMLSRTGGHYRIHVMIGMAFCAVALGMFSRMGTNTSHGVAVVDIILLGFGLGVMYPPMMVAVLNAVSYEVIGVATSTFQFVRSIGSTLGLAVLGSIMTARFASNLVHNVTPGVKAVLSPEQLQSVAHDPQAIMSQGGQAQLQTQFAHTGADSAGLAQQMVDSMRHALASALNDVFLLTLAAIIVAWLTAIFLKEIPLKGRAAAKSKTPPVKDEPEELAGTP